jgi:hypothetical protein
MNRTLLASLALAGLIGGGAAVTATTAPAAAAVTIDAQFYGAPPPPPAPPAPGPWVGAHRVYGRIVDSQPYFISVRAGDQVVAVRMHTGTEILPTGTTLVRGMRVGVDGDWDDRGNFRAYRIVLR